jgi:amino acid adenylation domain-containing protein
LPRYARSGRGEDLSSPSVPAEGLEPSSGGGAGVTPLSFQQEGLWFFEQMAPDTSAYNIAEAWRLSGRLNIGVLQTSLDEIARRHETLRTVFGSRNGVPVQIVLACGPFALKVTDLRGHRDAEAKARELAAAEARRPFDLTRRPLARVSLFRVDETEHLLLLNMHHIISDAWSVDIFMRELSALYAAGLAGAASPLPDLPIQYGDYAAWQHRMLGGPEMKEKMAFWQEQLRGPLAPLALPTDHPRPVAQAYRGAALFFTWPASLVQDLQHLARREGATLFQVLLAAFKILLQRYTRQEDLIVGCPFTDREQVETERLIGFFVNMHVLRTNLGGDPTFRELLGRVRRVAQAAFLNREAPLRHILKGLRAERSLNRNPLFQVAVGFQPDFTKGWSLPGIEATRMEMECGASRFDLTVLATGSTGGLGLRFEYSTALFEGATVARLARQFQVLAQDIVARPERRISEFRLLTSEERGEILGDASNVGQPTTEVEHSTFDVQHSTTNIGQPTSNTQQSTNPPIQSSSNPSLRQCVHEIFEAQAAQTPDATALTFGDQRVSYGALNSQADRLAARLLAAGVGPETIVGIYLERSTEMIVAMLAVLKAGGAYLPLDRTYPAERLAFMLEDTGAPVVLTRRKWVRELPPARAQLLCVDEPAATWNSTGYTAASKPTAESLAYVIYTSGSTGTPKGVLIAHRGIVRLVRHPNYAQISPQDVFLQLSPISFDAATFEIWGALLNGARLVISPPELPSLDTLGRMVEQENVTILWLPAGLFNQMVDDQLDRLGGLRYLLAGGEALSVPHVLKAVAKLGDRRVINGYGPTEITTFTCCHPVSASWRGGSSVPIGRPINHTRVYVLDPRQEPVPPGVPGELYAGGDGVARGYLNRPELTAGKFISSPFDAPPRPLYRTGDLVRRLADGTLEFLGRLDAQLKIRGFRVEPGEVEAALSDHGAVREAVVVAREDNSATKQLVAYFVGCPGRSVAPSELRTHLAKKLPPFMVPSQFVRLDALPLTPNGKVDRQALPAPKNVSYESGERPVPPRTRTESLLLEIWETVLGRDSLGVYDDFFEVGGHSLLATQIVSRIARSFRVELPVSALFEAPTVAALARTLEEVQQDAPAPAAVIPRRAQRSKAEELLGHLDELSESRVEELLTEFNEQ